MDSGTIIGDHDMPLNVYPLFTPDPHGLLESGGKVVGLDIDGDLAWGPCLIHDTVTSYGLVPEGPPPSFRFDSRPGPGPRLMWWVGACRPNDGYAA